MTADTAMLMLSNETVMRATQGHWLVHAANSAQPLVCKTPALLAWIAQFVHPTGEAQALNAVPIKERANAAQVLQYLKQIGVLITQQPVATSSAESTQRSKQLLQQLARMSYLLTADVQGLGEFAETQLRASNGLGLEQRLFAIGAAMHALSQDLRALRQPHLHQQANALGLKGNEPDLKLHLGCGPVLLEGFINIDIAPAPLSMNVLWGLPFHDGQVAVVYASHVIEHLFFPTDVHAVLAEAKRVLKPGGTLRIVVPDIARCLKAYQEQDAAFFESRREHFSWWPEDATMLENFLTYAGVGAQPNYQFESHKYGYDFATMERALKLAGFVEIERSAFQQSRLDALHIEHLSEAARWRAGEEYLSLFVEARRP